MNRATVAKGRRQGLWCCVPQEFSEREKRFGRYDTEEARKETNKAYRIFIAQWATIGDLADPHKKKSYFIDNLAKVFLRWAREAFGSSDFGTYKTAIKTTLDIYSGTLVEEFGPQKLLTVQNRFVEIRWFIPKKPVENEKQVEKRFSRGHVNKMTCFVRRMFEWGIPYEFVPPAIAGALKYVPSLREGQTTAPECPPREAVPDNVVDATLPHFLPIIADIVRVQRLTAMRPGEICSMTVGNIDRSGEIWVYRPTTHKNRWRGQSRVIALGKPEQEILDRRMVGKENDDYIFTRAEAMQERKAKKKASRKPRRTPSPMAWDKAGAEKPKRQYRDSLTSEMYCKAVTNTIAAVNAQLPDGQKGIPHWTPYCLRHAAITEIIKTDGIDAARAVAGQESVNVTMIYNHADGLIAEEQAKKRKNPFE